MKPEEEQAYVQQARADPQAFVHLYDHYFHRIHAYVCYRVPSQQDAEDITAEVFLKAMRKLKIFEWHHEHSFAAWIFRIAHNMIVDFYRRSEQVEQIEAVLHLGPSASDDHSTSVAALVSRALRPEESLVRQQAFQRMKSLIETLSPRRQEVITLRFFGGLRNKEIANILSLDERTVASHLSRGLRDLRDMYGIQTSSRVLEEVRA